MSNTGSRKLLAVGLVWLMILAAGAMAYKWFIAPKKQQELVEQTTSDPRHRQRVKLAIDSFSGYCLFRSDEFKEELTNRGIGLELVDDKADYGQRIAAIKRGETPLAVFTIDALLKAGAESGELPATIVMIIDETTGADAMVAYKQAVPNVSALNKPEMRIVATRDSPSETLARVVTATYQLPALPKDFWIDAQGAADVYQKFLQAKPSDPRVFVLWEPYVSKVLENKATHVVMDSSRFRGYIVDVLVAQRQFLLENEDLVKQFIEAYQRAAYHWREQSSGMTQLVVEDAKRLGEPLNEAQAVRLVKGIWWKNVQENYAHFGLLSGNEARGLQHLDEIIRGIARIQLKTQAIARDPTGDSPNKLYYTKIATRLHEERFHPGILAGGADQPAESIRADAALGPLDDQQWQRLVPVGVVQVDPVVFAPAKAVLRPESEAILAGLVDTLKRWPQYYVLVRGQARAEGDPEANRQLAKDRAERVVEYLIDQGIVKHRVRAVSVEPSRTGGEAQTVTFVLGQPPY